MIRFVASASPVGLSGGGRLRSYWPAEALSQAGWDAKASKTWPTDGDVIVIHRPLAQSLLPMLRRYKSEGRTVLVDHDDEIERVPKSNSWQPNDRLLGWHRQVLQEADGVIVATDRLLEQYGPHAKRAWVVRNHLPSWVNPERFPGVRDGKVRVGWAGLTRTHRHDLQWLAQAQFDGLFTTIGDVRTPSILGLKQYEAFPAVGTPERFYKLMARADIGIVPLDNEGNREFNTSKSWLKSLEYVALGKPVVATDLPEHRRLLEGTGAGFLATTPQEMAEHIKALVRDSALREQMSRNAAELGRRLVLERHLHEWTEPLEAVWTSRTRSRPSASPAFAVRSE